MGIWSRDHHPERDMDAPHSSHNFADVHLPVLRDRCVELLAPALDRPGAVVIDATVGMGGHASELLTRFPDLHLIGLDRDRDALAISRERLAPFGDRITLVHTVYDRIRDVLDRLDIESVQGILFDLGVSSLQLDRADRGFSYSQDAPLDMRMDATGSLTAQSVLESYSERELATIFWDFGEEKLAARYARRIVEARQQGSITRSAQLVEIIQRATPAALSRQGHPAKRVFQALRIEVNGELSVLERALPAALDSLALGGRIVVESYQSLEDRIVKREFRARTTSSAPPGLPVELPEHQPEFTLLVRGAELAGDDERAANPRAQSVRLRAAERIRIASKVAQR